MITATVDRVQYLANGAVKNFDYPYRFLNPQDLRVVLTTDGLDVLTTYGEDYTVSGQTVQFPDFIPDGTVVTVYQEISPTQLMEYINRDDFPASSHEFALDKLTIILQGILRMLNFCVRVPSTGAPLTALALNSRKSRYIAFDEAGGLTLVEGSGEIPSSGGSMIDLTVDGETSGVGKIDGVVTTDLAKPLVRGFIIDGALKWYILQISALEVGPGVIEPLDDSTLRWILIG